MSYDENSFLQGLACGMALKGTVAGGYVVVGSAHLIVIASPNVNISIMLNGIVLQSYTFGASETNHTFGSMTIGTTYTVRASDGYGYLDKYVTMASSFETIRMFFWGDGSLNSVDNGYANHIIVNNQVLTMDTAWANFAGNIQKTSPLLTSWETPLFVRNSTTRGRSETSADGKIYQSFVRAINSSGAVEYSTFNTPSDGRRKTVQVHYEHGATQYASTSSLAFKVNDTWYTPNQMISNGIIEPLVLLWSGSDSNVLPNVLRLLSGGGTSTANYASWHMIFVLRPNYSISSFRMYSFYNSAAGDGLVFTWHDYGLLGVEYKD